MWGTPVFVFSALNAVKLFPLVIMFCDVKEEGGYCAGFDVVNGGPARSAWLAIC